MNELISLDGARQQLADAIASHQPAVTAPLNISPWVAMSLLQKAIRRGHEELAVRAAATLLSISAERLWRRCGGVAFEDIGIADKETVSLVTAALSGKTFRSVIGGEWKVASFLASRMATANKCRAADDLLMSADLHPKYNATRQTGAAASTGELLDIAIGDGELLERAIALWYALGTDRRPPSQLRIRRGKPQSVFDHLTQSGYPAPLVEIAREGFRRTGEVLCPLLVLLSDQGPPRDTDVTDEVLPPETLIRGVPGWAFDIYTREGRAAYQTFLQGETNTARWVRAQIAPSQRVNFLGGIVFRVEGGLVRRRMRWAVADELRRLVDIECQRPLTNASEILDLMRADLALLNEVRAHVC